MLPSIVLTVLAWAAPLAACPSLAGHYVCTYRNGHEALVVSENRSTEGLVTYVYNGSTLVADARPRPLPDDAQMRGQILRVWCNHDGDVRGDLRARYFDSGNEVGELRLKFIYRRTRRGLRQITDGELVSYGGARTLRSDVHCDRNK